MERYNMRFWCIEKLQRGLISKDKRLDRFLSQELYLRCGIYYTPWDLEKDFPFLQEMKMPARIESKNQPDCNHCRDRLDQLHSMWQPPDKAWIEAWISIETTYQFWKKSLRNIGSITKMSKLTNRPYLMLFYGAMTKYWTIQKMALTGDRETCGSVGVNPQKGVCLPFGGPFLPFSSFIIAT